VNIDIRDHHRYVGGPVNIDIINSFIEITIDMSDGL